MTRVTIVVMPGLLLCLACVASAGVPGSTENTPNLPDVRTWDSVWFVGTVTDIYRARDKHPQLRGHQDQASVVCRVDRVLFGNAPDELTILSWTGLKSEGCSLKSKVDSVGDSFWYQIGDTVLVVVDRHGNQHPAQYVPRFARLLREETGELMLKRQVSARLSEDIQCTVDTCQEPYSAWFSCIHRDLESESWSLADFMREVEKVRMDRLTRQADSWRRGTWSFDDVPFVPEPQSVEGAVPPGSGKGGGS